MPNNREWAAFVWLTVFLLWMLRRPEVRSSVSGIARALLARKVFVGLLLLGVWVTTLVVAERRLSLWNPTLMTATLIWFATSGVVQYVNMNEPAEKRHYFVSHAAELITATALVQAYLSLFVLSLPLELAIQLVVGFLGTLYAVVGSQAQYRTVRRLTGVLLGSFTAALVV